MKAKAVFRKIAEQIHGRRAVYPVRGGIAPNGQTTVEAYIPPVTILTQRYPGDERSYKLETR